MTRIPLMMTRSGGRRPGAGFTLVELMVVVAIAALLLSIAVPSYQAQVRKSRRTEARTALLDLAAREERFFSTANAYSQTPSDLAYGAAPFPMKVGSWYYSVDVNAPAPIPPAQATYTITAQPVAGTTQAADAQCQSFTVDQTGKQSSLDSGNADSTATCWQ